MTDLPTPLAALGDELDRATRADLTRVPRRRVSRRLALLSAAALALAIPGAAIAADVLLSAGDVAQSLPAGTKALIGTDPTCTTVTANVEYHCTLAQPPSGDIESSWLGTVEPTVDATKHVNGGCRSHNAAGTDWECYIGQTAVTEGIIGADFLGQYAPAPGVG